MFLDRLGDAAVGPCALAPGARVVVGASGGVDSTVLLRGLAGLGFETVAVYADHGLRPESVDEAAFVRSLAASLGVEARVVAAGVGRGNRQGAARTSRYAALAAVARDVGARDVAVGHTATDQAETVLMALVRGAGLRGLAGMPPRRALDAAEPDGLMLVRPLLWATRAEVEALAREHGWAWRDDASNETDAYRRNRIRHAILPLLDAEGGPDTAARIARAADAARAALAAGPSATLAHRAVRDAAGLSLSLAVLREATSDARQALLAEALRAAAPAAPRTRAGIARLDALLDAPPGRRVAQAGVTVWRDRDRLRFVPDAAFVASVPVGPDGAETRLGQLVWSDGPAGASWTGTIAADVPLVLRPWQPGERIYLRGRWRLVSDVLTDARVEPSERPDALVLVAGARVVAVVGHAAADRAEPEERVRHVAWIPAGSVVLTPGGR